MFIYTIIASLIGMLLAFPAFAQISLEYGDYRYENLACNQTLTYTIVGEENDRVVVHVTECLDTGGRCNGYACLCFDQCVRLYEPENHLIDTVCSAPSNNKNNKARSVIRRTLATEAMYSITVSDLDGTGNGTFGISIFNVGEATGATVLDPTSLEIFSIGSCGEVDRYRFDGAAGEIVSIGMEPTEGSPLAPLLEIYDPLGRLIESSGDFLVQQLPLSGTYLVLAYSAVNEIGGYRMRFNPSATTTTTSTSTTTVSVPSTLPGYCALCGDVDGSGNIVATDALIVLNHAVGITQTLYCPGYCPGP